MLVRQTIKTSGIDGIALTKLDVLDGFDEIKVCVGYPLDGHEHRPAAGEQAAQTAFSRFMRAIKGWQESTAGARSWAELPARPSNMCGGSKN